MFFTIAFVTTIFYGINSTYSMNIESQKLSNEMTDSHKLHKAQQI